MRKIKLVSIIAIAVLLMAGIVFSTAGEAYAASDSCSLSVPPVSGTGKLSVGTTSVTQGTSISYSVSTSTSGGGGMVGGSVKLQYVEFNGQTKSSSSGSFSTSGLSGTYTITAYFILDVWQGNSQGGTRLGTDYGSCSITIHVSVPEYRVSFDLNGGSRSGGGSLTQYISKGDSATPPSVYRTGYSFAGWSGSYSNVTSNRTITARWVDDIGPSGNVSASDGTGLINGYIAKDFKYTASDAGSGLSYCEYQTPGSSAWKSYTSGTIISSGSGNGVYRFRAVDRNGNVSAVSECTLLKIDSFGNAENIRDSFKVTSWYKVTLPPRVFDTADKDISGTYTFANYDTALAFCIAKETEFRVSSVESGWIYINILNESVSQLYSDKNLLDEAILKYAKKYISEEQQFRLGSNNYYTPIGSDFRPDPSALNTPAPALPGFLNSYNGYQLYFCPGNYVFIKARVEGISLNNSATITYIADDYKLKSGAAVTVNMGNESIKAALERDGKFQQGYYLVSESDRLGNSQKYIVYIDIQAPGVSVTVNANAAGEKDIFFDAEYVDKYAGTFHFLSVSVRGLLDNKDAYTCVKITGKNLDKIFTRAEDVPVLSMDNTYSGKYEITVYDRAGNALKFEIIIAGNPPVWTYTSLSNQTKLTVTVNVNDKNNALTGIELFRIKSNGEYVPIFADDDGTEISAATLSYILRTGGKYTIRVTDLFGRVTEMKPIFYKKGLPVGTLKGVSEGGVTNKVVTFSYDKGVFKLYRIESGGRVSDSSLEPAYDNLNKNYSVVFTPADNAEVRYVIFLASPDDEGIYIEYEFAIDSKPPEVEIIDAKGQSIPKDGSTVNAFKVSWSEDVSARVSLNNGMSSVYSGGVLDKDGIYTFDLRDRAGNTVNFKIALDNTVNFKIDGKYTEIDGKIYAKNDLTFLVMEAFTSFKLDGKKTGAVAHGQPLTVEDEYTVFVTDAYGNQIARTIIIDRTPPTYKLEGVAQGGKTNGSIKLTFEEGAACTFKNSTTKKTGELLNGETVAEHGKYTLTLTDIAGNKIDIIFEIDVAIDVDTNIVNGQIVTGAAKVKFLEEVLAVEVTKDGETVEFNKEYKDLGNYILTARDLAGNELKLSWEIIPQGYRIFTYTLPREFQFVGITKEGQAYTGFSLNESILSINETGKYSVILSRNATGEEFTIEIWVDSDLPTVQLAGAGANGSAIGKVSFKNFSKNNVTKQLFFNGAEIDYSGFVTEPGVYKLILTDSMGNTNEYNFEILYSLNGFAIIAVIVGVALVAGLTIFLIKSRKVKT